MRDNHDNKIDASSGQDDLFAVTSKAMTGDAAAFEELLRRKMPTISYHIRMIINNDSDVEDVIQEVALTMYRNIRKLNDVRAVNVWLQRIITSRTMDYIRKNKKYDDKEDIDDFDNVIAEENKEFLPAEFLERDDARTIIKEALNSLPPQRKRALTLYYFEDMSYKEIAEIMDLALSSVATSILRGKATIKERLESSNMFEGVSPLLAAVAIPGWGGSTVLGSIMADSIGSSITPSQINLLTDTSMTYVKAKAIAAIPKGHGFINGAIWTVATTAVCVVAVLAVSGNLGGADSPDIADIPLVVPEVSTDLGPTVTEPVDPINPGVIAFSAGECGCGHLNPIEASIVDMDLSDGSAGWSITNVDTGEVIRTGDGSVVQGLTENVGTTLPDGDYSVDFTFKDSEGQSAYLSRVFTIDFSGADIHYE
ncbi:MAG: sigma-70 family RNA polymerase sigma factor [Clostridiales Family XIII bacterium]|jgi:RNA polymerase sigma-70 factor (ECF subfamily)|nr:sigma-70 family RNA polymerase sigma factor [Clostridiales Family XIII bacterium]